MPENQRPGFWTRVGRTAMNAVDGMFIPGDAYSPQTGWDRQATITGIAGAVGNALGGPAGGYIARGIANKAQGRHFAEGMFGYHAGASPASRAAFAPQGGLSSLMGYQHGYTRAPMGPPNFAPYGDGVLPQTSIQQTQIPFQQNAPQMYPMLRNFNTGGHQAPSTIGVRDRGQGYTGEAAQSLMEGLSNASRFNTDMSFGDYRTRGA